MTRGTGRHENAAALRAARHRETVDRILKARAGIGDEATGKPEPGGERIHVIAFALAGEKYAIESIHVLEVRALEDLTPVPCTPERVLGIIQARGRPFPVLDGKRLFGLHGARAALTPKAILLKGERLEFAILADAILGMDAVSPEDIRPEGAGRYFKGTIHGDTTLVDAAALLEDDGLIVREEAG